MVEDNKHFPLKPTLTLVPVILIATGVVLVLGVVTVAALVLGRKRSLLEPRPVVRDEKREETEMREGSEHGFGEGFQRRSLEWRERGIRASLTLHYPDGRTSQHITMGKIRIIFKIIMKVLEKDDPIKKFCTTNICQ